MNSRQLRYAIQLAKVRNFSQVAEQLGISQPSLSKQILSLETELGIKLFDRNNIPLTLTAAGEHFISEAQKLLYKEDQLLKSMEKFKSGEAGRLVIGISPFRSLYLMPELIKKVREAYPGIEVTLVETGSSQLRSDVVDGKYDFAIVNLPVNEAVLDITPIEQDMLVLAVPQELAVSLPSAEEKTQIPELSIRECGTMPFVVVSQSQEMRHLFDRLCESEDFQPNIAVKVVGLTTAWAMVCAGIGATLLPLQFIDESKFENRVKLFKIKSRFSTRQPVIVTRRGQYLSEYARYAIDLLRSKG